MSLPILPNMTPNISLSLTQSAPLILNSIALEEIALAHLINITSTFTFKEVFVR